MYPVSNKAQYILYYFFSFCQIIVIILQLYLTRMHRCLFSHFSITSLKLTDSVVCTFTSAYHIIYSVLSAWLGEFFLHEYVARCQSKME